MYLNNVVVHMFMYIVNGRAWNKWIELTNTHIQNVRIPISSFQFNFLLCIFDQNELPIYLMTSDETFLNAVMVTICDDVSAGTMTKW